MELRLKYNDDIINGIQDRTNIVNGAEVARQSIAMFDWATQQAQAGYRIVAINDSGNSRDWPLQQITPLSFD